jgi:hypothetical protein
MSGISRELGFALLFAVLALVSIIIAQHGQNPYFTIAAAAFAVATYVTYPPQWAIALAKMLPGRRNDK